MQLPNKYCHNCGKQTLPAAKFCSSCGTSLASIDERPPEAPQPQTLPNRLRPKNQATFTPIAVGEDDDDEVIRADHAGSLHDLGISLSSLDIDLRVDMPIKETVGGLMQQGNGMGQGYVEPGRITANVDTKAVLNQISQEAGTIRK
jgi:hypothetical protein